MKALASGLAAILLSAPTLPATGPGTLHYSGWAPERYRGEFIAVTLFVADPTQYCGKAPEGMIRLGCAWRDKKGAPFIVALHPDFFPDETFARLVSHEGSHTLGWPKDHPL